MAPNYESTFTQRVIEVIENARLDTGMSVQELIDRSNIRRSSYFRKMRGETTFTTEDVDALAKALDLDPFLVLRTASEIKPQRTETETPLAQPTALDKKRGYGIPKKVREDAGGVDA